MWNSIASIVVTDLANTVKYGGGVLYNFVFTKFPFKRISGDVTAFRRIIVTSTGLHKKLYLC